MNLFKSIMLLTLISAFSVDSLSWATETHERLRAQNTFQKPEEVVQYYCGRDSSGFVWSGLLEIERKAFTAWADIPQQDSFYIAKKYEIIPSNAIHLPSSQIAQIQVRYEITGIGDAHGTRYPPITPVHTVTFSLKKIQGLWKIVSPDFTQIAPVVLESKFPSLGSN